MAQPVLAIVTDLIFSTKIFSTAKSLNVPIVGARSLDAVTQRLAAGVSLAILDLNVTAFDPMTAIALLKAAPTPMRIVAYLSHVQVDLATAARAAGASDVMARSAFVVQLPELLLASQI